MYFYLNKNLKEYTYQRIRGDLLRESALAAAHLEATFDNQLSMKEIGAIADRIGESLQLRTTIIGLDGVVLGDSDLDEQGLKVVENHLLRPEIQDALKYEFGEGHRFSTTVHKDMLYMARLFQYGSKQGFVRLAIPLSEIEIISGKLKKLLLISLLCAFFMTIIIGSTAFIFVSKPIKEISSLAQEVAMGNYTKRLSLSTKDEIGDLAKSINYMSEQIKTRIEEVVAHKSRFEAVLLSMCEGMMVVDKNGAILLMNKILSNLFHVSGDPVGRKSLEVVRSIEIQEIIDHVLQSKTVGSREISILLPDERTLQVYVAPVLRGKDMDGAVLVFHDITELRRLENIRKDFVANASHEIRTPLTSIKGYAETLLDGAIDDKENAKDFLNIISSDANRLVQLVDDLLDLSRLESDKLNLKITKHSIEPIMGRVMMGLNKQAKKRGITLKKNAAEGLSQANIDESAIAQVFLNLVDNAIKYNKDGGSVMITAQENDHAIQVDIIDTGIGIPEDDIPRLFERFYRVDKARSRQLGGTGLGLSIVKHIIQSHDGEVSVKSILEKGSTFSFTLPKS